MTAAEPTEIRKLSGGVGMKITWSDGLASEMPARVLRQKCPCAACRHELTGEQILRPESVSTDITIQKAELIGQYALGFQFSDGHATGIYTFENLRREFAR